MVGNIEEQDLRRRGYEDGFERPRLARHAACEELIEDGADRSEAAH
jgi:hypothetical protein